MANTALSGLAQAILERMEPDQVYEPAELRAFTPDLTLEGVLEVMRELWVARQVERTGYSGWRRERSNAPGHGGGSHGEPRDRQRPPRQVKPEELFDHDAFEGFFK